ncbi:MAG: 4Fe-4S ferredoxin [Gemmatimonadetes bacterium]|nr:4Fe-4S ferredoxin [Gemmatimonadota bacterium]NIO32698.1 4Fe-4S ferredoxin [Gemmatimonadota bacterium]
MTDYRLLATGHRSLDLVAMLWVLLIPVFMLAAVLAALLTLWLVGERGHLMLPSTRAAFRRGRGRTPTGGGDGSGGGNGKRGGLAMALHGYVYSRWPYQYISFAIRRLLPHMTPEQKRWWADRYHGKVLTTELARRVITLDHDIKRTDLERIIPYPMARDIVLKGPPNVVLLDCPCRAMRENPCQPTDVCMIVGKGDFVLEHQPQRSRAITQNEALDVLQAEHERGHVHTAYFKDAMGDRFYAICNCCSCCCGGLEAMRRGVPMVASSGYVAQVDEAACIACGDCETACPFDAVTLNDTAVVSWEKCVGCGVCEGQCENEAMQLVLDERKGLPMDVQAIGV